MKYIKHLIMKLVTTVLFYIVFSQMAYAYLDPGTGSYILQMVIATLLLGSLTVKLFWTKIKTFFRDLLSKRRKHGESEG